MLKELLLFAVLLIGIAPVACGQSAPERNVTINGARQPSKNIVAFEQQYRVRIADGRYWYDARCGAWGFEGGPAAGFIPPGLDVGAALRRDASNGATGVIINGRELHAQDVLALQQIVGTVYQGRFWLDAYGNVGYEGGPALLNLVALSRQSGAGQGNTYYHSNNTGISAGSSGGTSYVMGKDFSVILDH